MAFRYHINVKIVAKWRKRTSVEDSPMGSQLIRAKNLCTVLENEAQSDGKKNQIIIEEVQLGLLGSDSKRFSLISGN
jgi:hypothetical protein